MKRWRLSIKSLALIGLLVGLATLSVMPLLAVKTTPPARTYAQLPGLTISLTSKGMIAAPTSLKGGNYGLTIKNTTSAPRGIEMIGIDRASSPTVRYSKILKPGQTEKFMWYFAKGKTVYVRDVISWATVKGNFTTVTFGHMRKAIDVR